MRWRDVPLVGLLSLVTVLSLGTGFQVLHGYFPVVPAIVSVSTLTLIVVFVVVMEE